MLDRQAGEADPLLPQQLVGLALALHHLAAATGEDQDRLVGVHQGAAGGTRSGDRAESLEQVAPPGNPEVGVVT